LASENAKKIQTVLDVHNCWMLVICSCQRNAGRCNLRICNVQRIQIRFVQWPFIWKFLEESANVLGLSNFMNLLQKAMKMTERKSILGRWCILTFSSCDCT